MEIQYAILCREINKSPEITLRAPFSNIITDDLKAFSQIDIPLFISFTGGKFGTKYSLSIEISSDAIGPINSSTQDWVWDKNVDVLADIFKIKFTPIVYGFHTILISIDGAQSVIRIPIIKGPPPQRRK